MILAALARAKSIRNAPKQFANDLYLLMGLHEIAYASQRTHICVVYSTAERHMGKNDQHSQ